MTVPVLIAETNGQFEATLAGDATLRATAPTREGAVNALKTQLHSKHSRGELLWVSISPTPVHVLAGSWAHQDDLDDMVADIYRQRDAERPQ